MAAEALWIKASGWVGQACFFSRFFVQWWASERAGRSVAPEIFWWLSAGGAVLLAVYSVPRGEVVLLPGYLATLCMALELSNQTDGANAGRCRCLHRIWRSLPARWRRPRSVSACPPRAGC